MEVASLGCWASQAQHQPTVDLDLVITLRIMGWRIPSKAFMDDAFVRAQKKTAMTGPRNAGLNFLN